MKESSSSQIQWVMKFQGNKLQSFQSYPQKTEPKINLTVGTSKEEIKAQEQLDADLKREELESLEGFVEACKDFKESAKKSLDKQTDEATKSSDVTNNLKNLFQLILEFTKIMKKLRFGGDPPPPPKNP